MKVKAIFFGENVIGVPRVDNTTRPAVVDPTFSYKVQFVPTNYTFYIYIMMVGAPAAEDTVKVLFKTPTGEILANILQKVGGVEIPSDIPKDYAGLNLQVQMSNVILATEGAYSCDAYINDELSMSESLFIFAGIK